MTENYDSGSLIASMLLQCKAIKISAGHPYTWASGIKSPIYCDLRQTLSFPQVRRQIALQLTQLVKEKFPDVEVIAGVATGAIAHGVLVAEELGLPFVYVRSAAKEHGLHNLVEGRLLAGQKTIVVEDLVSTGKSSIAAVKSLLHHGFVVEGMVAIFTYGLQESEEMFRKNQHSLFTLTNYNQLIETALQESQISSEELAILQDWKVNPRIWGNKFLK
ncbi:MAG TPA: orotate phosphoribosyltransferase [Bacteroidales bacterium]|nr:orotate phosphoribosyltransferase [Bacteroidales bacterium]